MIVVVGPGRCGTSATVQAIQDLEPALVAPCDPMPANDYNPNGYTGESIALNQFCLNHLHPYAHTDELGEWWLRVPYDLEDRARHVTAEMFGDTPWHLRIVKAPILSLSLAWFLHTVWRNRVEVVVTSVRPLAEQAQSARAFRADPTLGVEPSEKALHHWGNVVRTCGRFQLPLVVSSFEQLTEHPGAWQANIGGELARFTRLSFMGNVESVRPEWRHRCA